MKRKIITIDEAKCTGCGLCVPDCPEGALQIINGKVRLVGDLLCDGLGACIGTCPEGAMSVEEREAEEYNEARVMDNVVKGGPAVIAAHLEHLTSHGQDTYAEEARAYLREHKIPLPQGQSAQHKTPQGCPGVMMKDFRASRVADTGTPMNAGTSQLQQWPVQLTLLNPHAPYFKNADLVVAADCVPFSFANFHQRFLKDKILAIFCPKLDADLDAYREKLTTIIRDNDLKSITIVRMEVPCCGGTVRIVEDALRASGKNVVVKEYTISLQGDII